MAVIGNDWKRLETVGYYVHGCTVHAGCMHARGVYMYGHIIIKCYNLQTRFELCMHVFSVVTRKQERVELFSVPLVGSNSINPRGKEFTPGVNRIGT